ncbi:MAG: Cys-tRNA(Pro) deacylase [Erysipelotrichales bacterium]|nr:Cys-tRNA(Pro) deacylase [Erysipelotrichales bacterium]MBQ2309196.1 Cys-tRNA(Pro) deacylase [Erysipelotrichales bacterium]MBQ2478766.1 Cys-tRNA(Pro) deacylase [Erysipelotrichales bacterium]MBQ4376054.1 Cys-tRNA(Pro) deacylase [Erysipelotrichales bacterium]MBQ5542950.1 Cys-tRNA(Pro) deacylase [Erysipelotrichales bacterium]
MANKTKTNALRMLDSAGIRYTIHEYRTDGPLDAVSVAGYLHEDPDRVFKTLVTAAPSGNHYVFCIPGNCEMDLKKCAKAVKEKSIAMIPQKELLPLTGYIHGGCSPVGMKKPFVTVIHETAMLYETICVSAGKIGMQAELDPEELRKLIGAEYADLVRE